MYFDKSNLPITGNKVSQLWISYVSTILVARTIYATPTNRITWLPKFHLCNDWKFNECVTATSHIHYFSENNFLALPVRMYILKEVLLQNVQ